MQQVYLDSKDNHSSKTKNQWIKILLSLEMGLHWNSPRNLRLKHYFFLSQQVAPSIDNIFPRHILGAYSEVLTATADDKTSYLPATLTL